MAAERDGETNAHSEPIHVAHAAALERPGARIHVCPAGRRVTVLRDPRGQLRCVDSVCYHAGGPLGHGPLEEVNGQSCIVCPWHSYKITLDHGEKLYRATEMSPDGKLVPVGWRSAGVRQRCHLAYEEDGEVFVKLNRGAAELPSDKYACRPLS